MKNWFQVLLVLMMGTMVASAQRPVHDYSRSEFIVVSGGPALRKWEDYRIAAEQHDRWWGNFIRSARIRIQQLRRAHGPAARITWLVYRRGYELRVREDTARQIDQGCTMSKIESVRDAFGLNLVWFSSGEEIISYLNSRPRRSVVNFDYFGHSNRHCFMFEYSGEISATSTAFLHETQLGRIRGGVFDKNATVRSWGCWTGQSFSKQWRRAVGIPMEGVLGKTDYSVISDNVSLPRANGAWTR